jgi:hypothetical protein
MALRAMMKILSCITRLVMEKLQASRLKHHVEDSDKEAESDFEILSMKSSMRSAASARSQTKTAGRSSAAPSVATSRYSSESETTEKNHYSNRPRSPPQNRSYRGKVEKGERAGQNFEEELEKDYPFSTKAPEYYRKHAEEYRKQKQFEKNKKEEAVKEQINNDLKQLLQESCPHKYISRMGSNFFLDKETCKNCGKVLKQESRVVTSEPARSSAYRPPERPERPSRR